MAIRTASLCTALLAAVSMNAENLVFNPGFELGDAGYACIKFLRVENNPGLIYEGPSLDTKEQRDGKPSLRIPNRFGEQVQLFSKQFELEPGAEYTVSVWLKSDAKELPVYMNFCSVTTEREAKAEKTWAWTNCNNNAVVGREWKQYTFSARTVNAKCHKFYSFSLQYCFKQEDPAATLWLSALQVSKGKTKAFDFGSDAEAAVRLASSLYEAEPGKNSIAIPVDVVNNGSMPRDLAIGLEVSDDFYKDVAFSGRQAVSLGAFEKKTVLFSIPLKRFGSFSVRPKIEGTGSFKTLGGSFAYVGKYERRPVDLDKDFCVGVNMSLKREMNNIHNPFVEKRGIIGRSASCVKEVELLSKMGCRIIRDWGYRSVAFSWETVEQKQGKFDFAITDATMKMYDASGMKILPVLGGSSFLEYTMQPWLSKGWPEWVRKQSEDVTKDAPRDMTVNFKCKVNLPPIDLFKAYVRAIGERYKGRISHYEIANEPNLYLKSSQYLPYLKASFEELKKADPANKVVGFCITGDLGGNMLGFLEPCMKDGGLNYADIVSFHPYNARELRSTPPSDKLIADLRVAMRKFGDKELPLWNTELYYLYENKHLDYYDAGSYQPYHAARRFLTDLGEGVGQSISIEEESLFKPLLIPGWKSFASIIQLVPSANFVAYNALARFFEGAKPVAKFRWPFECICYVYERDGKYLAAFWNYGEEKGIRVDLDIHDRDAALYDVFGNVTPLNGIVLNDSPYYLTWSGSEPKALLEKMKTPQLTAAQPVTLGSCRAVPSADGLNALFLLRNGTSITLKGVASLKGNGIESSSKIKFSIPAASETLISLPLETRAGYQGKADLYLVVDGKLYSFKDQALSIAKTCVANTGDFSPMESLSNVSRGERATHNVSFKASHDGEVLRLKILVKDSTPSGPSMERMPWEQDCVELFFDTAPTTLSMRNSGLYTPDVARIFILPYAPTPKRLVVWPGDLKNLKAENVDLKIFPSPSGYEVELSLPLSALQIKNPKGAVVGFDIGVDDANGVEKAKSQLLWNSRGDASKNRLNFGFIKCK